LSGENIHLADFNILVLPLHRQQGIGRSLLGAVAEYAHLQGKTILITGTTNSISAGERFVKRIGAVKVLETNINQLDLSKLDRILVENWNTRSKNLAYGPIFPATFPLYMLDLI
jgi:hypothetical protein